MKYRRRFVIQCGASKAFKALEKRERPVKNLMKKFVVWIAFISIATVAVDVKNDISVSIDVNPNNGISKALVISDK